MNDNDVLAIAFEQCFDDSLWAYSVDRANCHLRKNAIL